MSTNYNQQLILTSTNDEKLFNINLNNNINNTLNENRYQVNKLFLFCYLTQ